MKYNLPLAFLIMMLFCGCKDAEPTAKEFPIIRTLIPEKIDSTGVTFQGELITQGEEPISSYGFIWSAEKPLLKSSNEIEVGKALTANTFEKRIDYDLARGVEYQIRAYAKMGDKTIYGNIMKFLCKGSNNTGWSLEKTDFKFQEPNASLGNTVIENEYLLLLYFNIYKFNPKSQTFTFATKFPVSGNTASSFTEITMDKNKYYFNNMNTNLYKFDNGTWSIQSKVPFEYGRFSGYYQGVAYSNKIYILSSYCSYMYDPTTQIWQAKARLPINEGFSFSGTVLKDKAYILTSDKNIWEYNFSTDSWILKTKFPGYIFEKIISFSYGDQVYFGLSFHDYIGSNILNQSLWSYNPTSNEWKKKEDFPMSFSSVNIYFFPIMDNVYIYTGVYGKNNLWKYNPSKTEGFVKN